MQVTVEDKSNVTKVLHFEVPRAEVAKELDQAYNELKKSADIKGFRKGKVPRKVLENKFSKDVHADIAPRLIQESFSKALEDYDLKVVGSPRLDPPDLDPESSYKFDITVDIKPEINQVEYDGFDLTKTAYRISEDEVESQIHMIRKTMASKQKVEEERPVKEGDFVLIDYEGFLGGQPFDKTPKVENYVMAIGNDNMPEEFSRKLTGVIPEQELNIDVTYPEDATDEDLAGKAISYRVKLKEIQEEVLPEADDNLVKELGQYETLDEVRDTIRENLEKGYEQRTRHELSEQVFQKLLDKHEFEVPQSMVEAELEGIISETEQAYTQNNTSLEEAGLSKEILRERYKDVAEKQARRHLILEKIIEQENLELTEEEMEASFEKMATDMNASVDAVKNFFSMNENALENYKHTQLEKKAVDLIIEKGNITEVEPEESEETGADEGDEQERKEEDE
ncbi:MAG: trigger factor [Desulfarculaceae bacterium]|nr:trigger factor [Desulfarculaceae bacterium]